MTDLRLLSEHRCHGGLQSFYEHDSEVIGLPMRFGVFRPPQADAGPGPTPGPATAQAPSGVPARSPARLPTRFPILYYLAGLTCNQETFAIKAGAQRLAAELGLMIVTPDTSPRHTGIDGAAADWDFGDGAGFYLDATEAPWHTRWRMETYLTDELRRLIAEHFPADPDRAGVFGHSMGGHGALTLALRHPDLYRSVSALAPIAAPAYCPWGVKAFSGYLGDDPAAWAAHDATALVEAGRRAPPILIDQGLADKFLAEQQLLPERFEAACAAAGQPLELRRHAGYDHGYFFIASFVGDHLAHHARQLGAGGHE